MQGVQHDRSSRSSSLRNACECDQMGVGLREMTPSCLSISNGSAIYLDGTRLQAHRCLIKLILASSSSVPWELFREKGWPVANQLHLGHGRNAGFCVDPVCLSFLFVCLVTSLSPSSSSSSSDTASHAIRRHAPDHGDGDSSRYTARVTLA